MEIVLINVCNKCLVCIWIDVLNKMYFLIIIYWSYSEPLDSYVFVTEMLIGGFFF